jgi:hypothetical protein
LLIIPAPPNAKYLAGGMVRVNALAAGVKTMEPISFEAMTLVTLEKSNVAVSPKSLGTVSGVQFWLTFQLPEMGVAFQVALAAKLSVPTARNAAATRTNLHKGSPIAVNSVPRGLSSGFIPSDVCC